MATRRECDNAPQFPRLQKRGPIEAYRATKRARCLALFPRLQKRGPIEAELINSLGGGVVGFHAYKSVAPLKLINRYLTRIVEVGFPRLQKRGPIEAQRTTMHDAKAPAVSTLTKAWPH